MNNVSLVLLLVLTIVTNGLSKPPSREGGKIKNSSEPGPGTINLLMDKLGSVLGDPLDEEDVDTGTVIDLDDQHTTDDPLDELPAHPIKQSTPKPKRPTPKPKPSTMKPKPSTPKPKPTTPRPKPTTHKPKTTTQKPLHIPDFGPKKPKALKPKGSCADNPTLLGGLPVIPVIPLLHPDLLTILGTKLVIPGLAPSPPQDPDQGQVPLPLPPPLPEEGSVPEPGSPGTFPGSGPVVIPGQEPLVIPGPGPGPGPGPALYPDIFPKPPKPWPLPVPQPWPFPPPNNPQFPDGGSAPAPDSSKPDSSNACSPAPPVSRPPSPWEVQWPPRPPSSNLIPPMFPHVRPRPHVLPPRYPPSRPSKPVIIPGLSDTRPGVSDVDFENAVF